MRRITTLLTVLALFVIGGVVIQKAVSGGPNAFGPRYPLPALETLNLGPLGEVPASLLLVAVVVLLVGGTVAVGVGLAVWFTRTTLEMIKQQKLPTLSGAVYRGEKAKPGAPISDSVAVALVFVGLVLAGLWGMQRSGAPLPAFGTLNFGPLGDVRGDALFTVLVAVMVVMVLGVGWALAFWFRRTTEEMDKIAGKK